MYNDYFHHRYGEIEAREFKSFALNHTASKWRNQDLNSGSWIFELYCEVYSKLYFF